MPGTAGSSRKVRKLVDAAREIPADKVASAEIEKKEEQIEELEEQIANLESDMNGPGE